MWYESTMSTYRPTFISWPVFFAIAAAMCLCRSVNANMFMNAALNASRLRQWVFMLSTSDLPLPGANLHQTLCRQGGSSVFGSAVGIQVIPWARREWAVFERLSIMY